MWPNSNASVLHQGQDCALSVIQYHMHILNPFSGCSQAKRPFCCQRQRCQLLKLVLQSKPTQDPGICEEAIKRIKPFSTFGTSFPHHRTQPHTRLIYVGGNHDVPEAQKNSIQHSQGILECPHMGLNDLIIKTIPIKQVRCIIIPILLRGGGAAKQWLTQQVSTFFISWYTGQVPRLSRYSICFLKN